MEPINLKVRVSLRGGLAKVGIFGEFLEDKLQVREINHLTEAEKEVLASMAEEVDISYGKYKKEADYIVLGTNEGPIKWIIYSAKK